MKKSRRLKGLMRLLVSTFDHQIQDEQIVDSFMLKQTRFS